MEGETMALKERQPLADPLAVASYLRIPVHTLAQWRSRGQGPTFSRVGRHVRYRWTDVERWIEDRQRGGGEAA
jgi:hypothetical protein